MLIDAQSTPLRYCLGTGLYMYILLVSSLPGANMWWVFAVGLLLVIKCSGIVTAVCSMTQCSMTHHVKHTSRMAKQ